MSPDEVISKLEKLGVKISRATLNRYEKQGLIPEPTRGGNGRSKGRWTDYPDHTVEEAYVVWRLMRGEYGDPETNNIFFDGNPPKIKPMALKKVKEKIRSQKDVIEIATIMEEELDKNFISEMELKKTYAQKKIGTEEYNSQLLINQDERFNILTTRRGIEMVRSKYDDIYYPIIKFIYYMWLLEIASVREKMNVIE